MSNGINKVIAIGNCCDDPSVRYTPDGKAVTNITIACNESWKDKATGAKKEKVEFIRIVFFGGVAGVAGEYLKKGSKVYIEGKLQTRDYEKDGIKRYVTEVVVDGFSGTMQMLDSRSDAPAQQSQPQQQPAPKASTGVPGGPVGEPFDDDIPLAQHERFLLG